MARYALIRLGLNPGKDVIIVQTGSTPERLAAMESRRVSGSTLVPPAMFTTQKKAFIYWPMSRLWAWRISIKAASRLNDTCVNIPKSSATSSNLISRPCTGLKRIAPSD